MNLMIKKIRRFGSVLLFYIGDVKSILMFGSNAPNKHMLLFVNPLTIKRIAHDSGVEKPKKRTRTAIKPGDWDLNAVAWESCQNNLDNLLLIGIRKRIWLSKQWSETGLYERMDFLIQNNDGVFDGCRNRNDVILRYQNIDNLILYAQTHSKILPQSTFAPDFRERGGIDISIGRTGELFKSGGGGHRLAIAKSLNLPVIPVSLNAVHPDAITSGKWDSVLKQSRSLALKYWNSHKIAVNEYESCNTN